MIICPKCSVPIFLSHSSRINCECGTHFDEQGGILFFARDYEEFFAKMGTEELKNLGLDPDEIRLKMDQIMEWNEPNTNNK